LILFPFLPQGSKTKAGRVGIQNSATASGQLPDLPSVVDTYFDFVEKVLANQRESLMGSRDRL